ncbi:MAG TPA: branched-chain amino acid ABC transporter permease [Candidatus Competibacteraceae bacterium]|nr:branched-chain amino acid ABC transporter permease [Candidatus Competibacteraceae bacterium]
MTQMIVNGLVLGTLYALIALGLTLIFSIMRVVNFAHGQMYMLGGFVVYYLNVVFGLNYFLALLGAIVTVGLVGVLFEVFLFRRVMRIAKREENTMLLAMGTALLLESLAYVVFGEKQRGVPPIVDGVLEIGDAFLPLSRLLVMALSAVMIVALLLFVQYTRPGRAMRAVAQDKEVTYLQGVNIKRIGMLGFFLGAALAGAAGGLLVTVFAVNAGIGTAISVKAFLMVMIGGAGVTAGAILGAFALGFAEAIGYEVFPGSITYLLIFIGIIVFLLIRPQGIMGRTA